MFVGHTLVCPMAVSVSKQSYGCAASAKSFASREWLPVAAPIVIKYCTLLFTGEAEKSPGGESRDGISKGIRPKPK